MMLGWPGACFLSVCVVAFLWFIVALVREV